MSFLVNFTVWVRCMYFVYCCTLSNSYVCIIWKHQYIFIDYINTFEIHKKFEKVACFRYTNCTSKWSNPQKQWDMKMSQNLSSWGFLLIRMQKLPSLYCFYFSILQLSQGIYSFFSPSGTAASVNSPCILPSAICPWWISASPPMWHPNWSLTC